MNVFDVAVIGARPAGSATTLGLLQRGHSVILIERTNYLNVRVGETLPPAVKALLGKLGAWERFQSDSHVKSVGICSIWGSETPHENDHFYNPYGAGWHIDRARFDALLA